MSFDLLKAKVVWESSPTRSNGGSKAKSLEVSISVTKCGTNTAGVARVSNSLKIPAHAMEAGRLKPGDCVSIQIMQYENADWLVVVRSTDGYRISKTSDNSKHGYVKFGAVTTGIGDTVPFPEGLKTVSGSLRPVINGFAAQVSK